MLAKGQRVHIAEQIRVYLEEEIFLGKISAGDRIDEQTIAKRFGASRTPVREALHHLSSAGLVSLQSGRGAIVARLTMAQIIDMLQVLAELEGLAAGLAAAHMTDKQIGAFEKIHEECTRLVAKNDIDKYYASAKSLHELMYEATRNDFLFETSRNLRNRVFPYLRYQLRSPGRAEACLKEQQLTVERICARDIDGASRAARDHVLVQRTVFSEFIVALEKTGMADTEFVWSLSRSPTTVVPLRAKRTDKNVRKALAR
jgi:DNA-binding GntR family transcriptional regulator